MYSFCKDVYFVKGKTNGCFYDLSRKQLIHCSLDYIEAAQKIIALGWNTLSQEEQELVTILMDAGVLEEAETVYNTGNIEELKEESKIDFAWVEITDRCNMKCIHCYDEACPSNGTTLSVKEFCHVVDQLKENGIKSMQIIGGEPLMVKELPDMVKYACKHMKHVTVFTNASKMTDSLAELFAKYGVRTAVSVYSYIPRMHDKVTKVPGSHMRTMDGLECLHRHGVPFRVANVRMAGIEIGEKNTDLFDLKGKGDIVRLTGRASAGLLDEKLIRAKLITEETFTPVLERDAVIRSVSGHNCFSRRLYIAADMNVYPCVMERRLCHGNLKTHGLADLLNSEIIGFNKTKVDGCKECEFRYVCFDCRPNTLTGNLQEKPWYCTYQPEQGVWIDPDSCTRRIEQQRRNE